MIIVPDDRFLVPADHLIVLADHFIVPANNFTVPADHFIVPANRKLCIKRRVTALIRINAPSITLNNIYQPVMFTVPLINIR